MALTVPSAREHTVAVVAALIGAGLTVGNGSGAGLTTPYAVVYADLGALDGPMGDRFADLAQTLTIHYIGAGPDQAQWVADKGRAALLAGVNVPGRALLDVVCEPAGPVQRDDDVSPPLFLAIDLCRIATTPS